MKIKTEFRLHDIPQNGYTAYDTNPHKLSVKYCRWWAYPAFKLATWLHYEKIYLHCALNEISNAWMHRRKSHG